MKKRVKKVLALLLVFSFAFTTTPYKSEASQSTRDKLNQAQKEVDEAKSQVDSKQDEVDKLTDRKNGLKKELNKYNSQMEEIVEKINDLEEKISAKETEIEETNVALDEARTVEETQYASMKKRIQFLYEDSQNLYLDIMFQAKSFSQFITLSNYVDALSAYDRKMLEEYKATRKSIEELEARLEEEKQVLDGLKEEADQERVEMQVLITNTGNTLTEYSDLLEDAEAELLEYEAELKRKNDSYAAIKKQLEEELRLSRLAANSVWRDISDVTFEAGDKDKLAVLIYCEAGGEPYEGQVAVGAVVINRLLSGVYPNTLEGVIRQKWQFSPVASGRYDYYLALGKTTQSCRNAAEAAMKGETNVGNCLHFRTPIPGLNGIAIGNHVFY